MTSSASLLAAATTVLLLSVCYSKLRYLRFRQYANFAQHPASLVFGHLKLFGDFVKRNKPNAHADLAIVAMHRALGRPPLMFLDMRPISDPMVVVANYDIAEQITKSSDTFPTSAPKSHAFVSRMRYLSGATSILTQNGDAWKLLRKRFNPGFSSQYLTTFVPEILDKGLVFLDRLDARCCSGESFSLMDLTMRLTFDVIGKVVMEADLDAQNESNPGELVSMFDALLEAYGGETITLPWWLLPGQVRRRSARSAKISNFLRGIVREKHAELHSPGNGNSQRTERSVLSLSLQEIDTLTPRVIDETCDQLQTFLFAGHDTTSILLSWAIYELSLTPHALAAVRSELDALFGPDDSPSNIRTRLLVKSTQDALAQLPYMNAVIKETLRVHPPGGSARVIAPGSGFSVRMPGTEKEPGERVVLDGLITYICQSLIHSDLGVFGDDVADFVPERWLSKGEEKQHPVPAGAWRPFERGPRNCIGQELANIEVRVILALVVKRYDFVKVGIGAMELDGKTGLPILDERKRRYKVEEEVFVTRMVTSKPIDGMVMKVKLAG